MRERRRGGGGGSPSALFCNGIQKYSQTPQNGHPDKTGTSIKLVPAIFSVIYCVLSL